MKNRCCALAVAALKPGMRRMATAAAAEKKPTREPRQSTSFMLNLFRGRVEGAQVFPFPDPLTEDQRQTLVELVPPVEKFFQEVNDPARNDRDMQINEETLSGLWELGAFGLQVPADLGGLGLNNTQYARLVENESILDFIMHKKSATPASANMLDALHKHGCFIVGAHDLGVGITLGAHQSIGFKGILLFGTPEQKQKYLTQVTSGTYAAFALTEPSSGSDAGSIKTRAVPSADGSHYVLNGSKIWISNGGIAEIMTVFAQTPVQKDGKTVDKVTAFVVERGFGGVSSGPPEHKMGIRCSNTAEVYFEDVKVPAANVLGGLGNGFKVAMNILNNGRFGMAAALAGTQRAAIRQAAEHAAARTQFQRKISEFQTTQEKLARMATLQYVTESLAYMVSGNMDSGSTEYHLEAAVAKTFASEAAWDVVDEAIQILGGMGYMQATGLERVLRDLRIFRIFEGTNDILRLFIALTGIQFAGGHLQELARAFQRPTAHLGLIVGEVAKRGARAVGLPPVADLTPLVAAPLRPAAKELALQVDAFGQLVEVLLRAHGKEVVEQQGALNQVAQAAMDLYTTAVVLSRASRAQAAEAEPRLAEAWATAALERVPRALHAARSQQQVRAHLHALGADIARNAGVLVNNPLNI